MARQKARWVHQIGSGYVYTGPGWIVGVVVYFNDVADFCYVYDGVDVGSGRLMLHLVELGQRTRWVDMGPGYRFERGIYLEMENKDMDVTVLFEPDL